MKTSAAIPRFNPKVSCQVPGGWPQYGVFFMSKEGDRVLVGYAFLLGYAMILRDSVAGSFIIDLRFE